MKKIGIILFAILLGAMQAKAYHFEENGAYCNFIEGSENDDSFSPKEITILNGSVILEVRKGVELPCIGIRFTDKKINMGLGTYLEIKKKGEFYLVENADKKYRDINKGIEDYLKDLIEDFYDNKKYGKEVWSAFVKEGGLQLFLDITREFIDDEFLSTPFNETYG